MARKVDLARYSLVVESLVAGFYVNVTRSLAPIFMASVGMSVKEIVELNFYSYLLAFFVAVLMFNVRERVIANVKKTLLTFHVLERLFWGLVPISYYLNLLNVVYPLAVVSSVPTSAMITLAVHSVDEVDERKKILYYRSSFGALSNLIGSATTIAVLYTVKGDEKYLLLYALAFVLGILSSLFVAIARVGEVKVGAVREETRVKYVVVFLFLLLVTSSSAMVGAVWSPFLIIDLKASDYIAALVSSSQTLASIISPIFWAKRSYRTYRFAVLCLSAVPVTIYYTRLAIAHVGVAFVYAFFMTASNTLASFLFAELSEARDRLSFLSNVASTSSQLLGMSLALLLNNVEAIFVASSVLIVVAAVVSLFAIPEVAVDPEKARIYARAIYSTTISGYSFSVSLTKEASLFAIRSFALLFILTILIFLYRFSYYLSV